MLNVRVATVLAVTLLTHSITLVLFLNTSTVSVGVNAPVSAIAPCFIRPAMAVCVKVAV